jgi:hypothetical protein
VLILTVIGIPLALLLLLGYVGIGLLALTIVALQVGRHACRLLHLPCQQSGVFVVTGLLLLHSLSLIGALIGLWPPFSALALFLIVLGIAVKFCAFCYGIGTIFISRFGSSEPVHAQPVVAE